jgi:hypothetical protein
MMTKNEDMNTPAPTPLPASLKQAVTLWLLAIGAGVFETILVVANVLWGDGNMANGEGLNAGVAARLVIFVAMTLVALQLRLGKNWARLTIGMLIKTVIRSPLPSWVYRRQSRSMCLMC